MTDRITTAAAQLVKRLSEGMNEDVYTIVADLFRDVTGASRVLVYIVPGHLDNLVLMGDTGKHCLGTSFPLTSEEYPCRILRQYSKIHPEVGRILGHPFIAEIKGYLGVPLLFNNESFGLIEVIEPDDTYLENPDMLETLTFPVNLALRNMQLMTELRNQSEVVDTVNKIAKIVSSSLRIDVFYENFANEVKKLVDFDRISIALADEKKENFKIYALASTKQNTKLGKGVNLPLAGTAPGWVIENKKPLIVKDLIKEKAFIEDETLISEGIRSALRLPLVINDGVLATLQINSSKVGLYGERELVILQKVADRIAEAIENTILFNRTETINQKLVQQNIRLETINAVALAVNESLDPEVVLQKALSTVLGVTGWDCGDILMWDDKNNFLQMVVHQGLSQEFISQWKIQKETVAYESAVTGKTIYISGLDDSPKLDYLQREGIVSAIHIPLYSKHKLVGVMPIATRNTASQPPDQALLNSIGKQIGVAIENAKLYQRIRELAEKDSLTGLWNRRKFYEFMELEIIRSERYNKHFALLMIDVDNFKKFNDTFGHLKGDEVLAATAKVIQKSIRESDYAVRLGGEEFAVIALESDYYGAWDLAERIRSHMEKEGIDKPFPTVSIGLGIFPENGNSVHELFTAADSALYAAKAAGRNKTVGRH